ncbi:MAG TPA: ABC transporter ATP-binding protein, partial [Actinotalea sp.]|nr:ABC transporter ATP-binding protein [Actinotalea sp.]
MLDLLAGPAPLPEPPPAPVPVIELRDVTRSFPGDPPVHALRQADLVVQAGEYVSVVGPSGSG